MLIVLTATVDAAMPVPTRDVEALVNQADLVVMGTVSDVSEIKRTVADTPACLGRVTARLMAGRVQLDETLKGPPVTTLQFQFYLPDQPIGYEGIAPATYRVIFFLNPGGRLR
jgi:hypothetical protein